MIAPYIAPYSMPDEMNEVDEELFQFQKYSTYRTCLIDDELWIARDQCEHWLDAGVDTGNMPDEYYHFQCL